MAFVVLYDACVLYPAPLRDVLVRLANTGVVRARWSAAILDECFRNLLENRPELKPEAATRLEPYNIEAKHPDDFVIDTIDLSPGVVAKVLAEQAARTQEPAPLHCGVAGDPARPRPRAISGKASRAVHRRRSLNPFGSRGASRSIGSALKPQP